MLGETRTWDLLLDLAWRLRTSSHLVDRQITGVPHPLANAAAELRVTSLSLAERLMQMHAVLKKGDLDLVRCSPSAQVGQIEAIEEESDCL